MSSRGSDAAPSGEREFIDHIRRRLPSPPPSLLVGPGDDAAVVVPERGAFQVITTDVLVEGIHFDRRFSSLADIGHKALAVNLSDLAAMGASPSTALLSLILPAGFGIVELDGLLDGFLGLATEVRVALAGGNISRSPGPLIVDVTAIGYVRPRRVLTRGGGKPGDSIWVTGTIGAAAAGLDYLQWGGARGWDLRLKPEGTSPAPPNSRVEPEGAINRDRRAFRLQPELPEVAMATCVQRHRRPEPRIRIGTLLGRNRAASACMDLSDGLADAVTQVTAASGTGAIVDAAALPIDPSAQRWFEARGVDPVTAAIAGGDDFELLIAVPKKTRGRLRAVLSGARGVAITRIGELTSDPRIVQLSRDGQMHPMPRGFTHF